jgi:acetolactate synthase small subunit
MTQAAPVANLTALAVDFHNIPGAMMRVLNCFTRRGLVMQAVCCGPVGDHHRAQVAVAALPITIEQIVRELESTVGVYRIEQLPSTATEQLLQTACR